MAVCSPHIGDRGPPSKALAVTAPWLEGALLCYCPVGLASVSWQASVRRRRRAVTAEPAEGQIQQVPKDRCLQRTTVPETGRPCCGPGARSLAPHLLRGVL